MPQRTRKGAAARKERRKTASYTSRFLCFFVQIAGDRDDIISLFKLTPGIVSDNSSGFCLATEIRGVT